MNLSRISTMMLTAVALALGLLTPSAPAHAAIGGNTPIPAAPSNLAAKAVGTTSVNLTWTNNAANQSGVVISLDGVTSVDVPGATVSSYTWAGLSPGTEYWFYVASKIYGTPGDPTGPGNTQSAWVGPVYATTPNCASPTKGQKVPYRIAGPWVAGRQVLSYSGFKNPAATPIGFMFPADCSSISMNLGPGITNSAWQPSLPLTWNTKDKAWEASGSWKVTTCGNGKLVPAHVTFVLYATSRDGSNATEFSGTYSVDQPKNECGLKADETSEEFLYAPFNPPWWSGTCDAAHVPGSYEGDDWHGLIACLPGDTYQIASGPLNGDLEWQCAELAQRWLYEEFGIPNQSQGNPPGGGETIVPKYWHYLTVANRTLGQQEPLTLEGDTSLGQPASGPLSPGDVISYSDPGIGGHVAIVIAVTVSTYTIIEQNVPKKDVTYILPYINHVPTGMFNDPVVGWLHIN